MDYENLKKEVFSFVYFSSEECSVCNVTKPLFENIANKYKEATFTHINLKEYEDAKGYFSVFTIPTILVFSNGKELLREARFFNFDVIESKLDRYYSMIINS